MFGLLIILLLIIELVPCRGFDATPVVSRLDLRVIILLCGILLLALVLLLTMLVMLLIVIILLMVMVLMSLCLVWELLLLFCDLGLIVLARLF